MADLDEMTQAILSAWDEDEGEPAAESEPQAEPEQEAPAELEPDEGESETEQADEGEEAEQTEEEEAGEEEQAGFDTDDLEIRAFLAKYGGDPAKALKGAAELARLMGRRDDEKNELVARNAALEQAIQQAQVLNAGAMPLSEEQQTWVEQAAMSANPAMYVQQAVDEGAFDMGLAVCREWARENPFDANRVGQYVEGLKYQAFQPPAVEYSQDTIVNAFIQAHPEVQSFVPQIAAIVQNLGDNHPAVQEARSTDPDLAYRGITYLYDVARASTVSVQRQRDEIRQEARAQADGARAKAAVSSASTSPKAPETPRQGFIMPGLTEADLDTEFASS